MRKRKKLEIKRMLRKRLRNQRLKNKKRKKLLRRKKRKRKKLKLRKRRKKRKPKTSRLTMPLIEINKLLIKQELMLSIPLFPKKEARKILLMTSQLAKLKPQEKLLLVKKLGSLLMTTKEEEPLQLLETP